MSTRPAQRLVQLRPWESHEIDIGPDEWKKEVQKAQDALRAHDHARKALELRANELEHSSRYHRSMMRAKWPEHYEATYRDDSQLPAAPAHRPAERPPDGGVTGSTPSSPAGG